MSPIQGCFFPGRKLVHSKCNCCTSSLLHLFRVCHFHGPAINKGVRRNIHVTRTARGHLLEDVKRPATGKPREALPWVRQRACWLHTPAPFAPRPRRFAGRVRGPAVPPAPDPQPPSPAQKGAAWQLPHGPASRDCTPGGCVRKAPSARQDSSQPLPALCTHPCPP